jgi:hypothetical protein
MDNRLRTALAGKIPLVVSLEGIPEEGQTTSIIALARPVNAQVNLEGYGSFQARAFLLTKEQARDLAVRITEIVGPLDLGAS